jgi:hypothetical protein
MTRNEIIEELFTGKNFNDCIAKMEPAHLRDDLKQEIAVIICQWTDAKVIGLHQEGSLEYYVVRVIINQIQSSSSEFFKKFRKQNYVFIDDVQDIHEEQISIEWDPKRKHKYLIGATSDIDIAERLLREELEDYTIEQIESLYWYDAEMIKMYLKHGTYRAIMQETKIPYISCYKNIQKSLETLRQKALAPKPVFTKKELSFIQNNSNAKKEN